MASKLVRLSAFGFRGVRILVDGIPPTTPDGQGQGQGQGSSIALTSIERIEVLRGPLAQLYGNSAGGVIQAFTRNAPEQPELGARYYAGSFGMRRSDLQYAGRIGGYGLVADYSTFDTGGYRAQSKTERRQFNSKLSFGAHVFMPYVGGVVPYRQKCDAVAANGYQGFRLSSSAAEPSDPAAPPVDRLRHDA